VAVTPLVSVCLPISTAVFNELFFDKMFGDGGLPPLEALRQKKLALYNSPERIESSARHRDTNFSASPVPEDGDQPTSATAIRHWASFVLSGPGR